MSVIALISPKTLLDNPGQSLAWFPILSSFLLRIPQSKYNPTTASHLSSFLAPHPHCCTSTGRAVLARRTLYLRLRLETEWCQSILVGNGYLGAVGLALFCLYVGSTGASGCSTLVFVWLLELVDLEVLGVEGAR
ncbi:hypothetical protein GALMADRAFT_798933 [Galerina marginata CBS 339.88]|uniref:Uncharacterized protein n=1 Tax=Galerina marginata (strain CBS 339.88) TaxID=685588 RepID=A0A067SK62_GALM3|nr:hypothetical protein GALMADRAFT_798933 [Galerina marginata CBS 339.88]